MADRVNRSCKLHQQFKVATSMSQTSFIFDICMNPEALNPELLNL